MSNEAEREAFYAYGESIGMPRLMLTIGEFKAFQAGAAYQRTQAQPADKLVEALELLYRKLKPNVNGADETYFFIGLRDQVTERQMERISEALATYRAAQEKK